MHFQDKFVKINFCVHFLNALLAFYQPALSCHPDMSLKQYCSLYLFWALIGCIFFINLFNSSVISLKKIKTNYYAVTIIRSSLESNSNISIKRWQRQFERILKTHEDRGDSRRCWASILSSLLPVSKTAQQNVHTHNVTKPHGFCNELHWFIKHTIK